MNYINDLYKNYPLESNLDLTVCSPNIDTLVGGKSDTNKPTGGFPPIYICEKRDKEPEKLKEFAKTEQAVSLSDIMAQRLNK